VIFVSLVPTLLRSSDVPLEKQQLRLLSSVLVAIGGAANLPAGLEVALAEIARATQWPCVQIWFPDEARGVLVCARQWHGDPAQHRALREASLALDIPRGEGLIGAVWTTGAAAWIRDLGLEREVLRSDVAIACGLAAAIAVPVTGAGGVVAVLELFTARARDEDEPLLAMIGAIAAQLGAAIERKRAEDALRASEMRFRSVTRTAQDAIICADTDGDITLWNPAARAIFGWSEDEILGRPLTTIMPERLRDAHREGLARLLATSIPRVIGKTISLIGLTRDGVELPIELSLSMWTAGGEIGFTAIVRDTTERRRIEQRLALADRMASVGQLASGVAHEINNPLAYVIANLGAAVEQAPPELRAILDETREGAERIRKIVRDLKSFARPDEETLGPVELPRVLDLACNMAANEIRHRAQLVKDYGDAPLALGNESRLGQVFVNLLVNAAHAIPEGHADQNEIRIVTDATADGRVVIEVRDTGLGIPGDARPHIFEPFFTTKPVGVGTGLGLAICHGIVTSLGGEIELEDQRPRGTIVRVILPAPREPTIERPAMELTAVAPRRGRVLVVEDEPQIARTLRRLLEREHDVTIATDGRAALDAVRADDAFDVILCDLMMPAMTGMDLHDELARTDPALADRMIFLTGGAFTTRARDFLDAVPNARIDKPFEPAALRALVRSRIR